NRFGSISMTWEDLPQTIWNLLTNPLVLAALFLYGFAVFFWIAALSRMDLNFAYPIFAALGYVLVTVASWVVLHEEVTMGRLIGVGIICIGLFVIARDAR